MTANLPRRSNGGNASADDQALTIYLDEDEGHPLFSLTFEDFLASMSLRVAGVDRAVVDQWLERHGIVPGVVVGAEFSRLRSSKTRILCCDERVLSLATRYGDAVSAPVSAVEGPEALTHAVSTIGDWSSLTLFMLNDRITEALVYRIASANRRREGGPLPYGFMTGFTPSHLAWLVAKTLIKLMLPSERQLGFADFDGETREVVSYALDPASGATERLELVEPWQDRRTCVLSVRTHGVSFDMSLGETVLCGHMDPRLPAARLVTAPVCFHDGTCFRLNRTADAPTRLLKAVHATPLFWGINSCGAVPLAGSAFGDATGYVFGLLAGAAVGVVAPYLTQPTTPLSNLAFGALLATGATMGEVAQALSQIEDPDADYDVFLLMGSPDARLSAARRVSPSLEKDSGSLRYDLEGQGRAAWRLDLPSEPDRRVPRRVVADDGKPAWSQALALPLGRERERSLLIITSQPDEFPGWVRIGQPRLSSAELQERLRELSRRIAVLARYPFVSSASKTAEECQSLLQQVLQYLNAEHLLRHWVYGASFLALLMQRLDSLEREAASGFVERVVTTDFSFDRESYNGFNPGLLRRSARSCSGCGEALYEALDQWTEDATFLRRKDVCANCFGVAMRLLTSPISTETPTASFDPTTRIVTGTMRIENPGDEPVSVWAAAAPRHGPRDAVIEPSCFAIPPRSRVAHTFTFVLRPDRRGVMSFRFFVSCQGAAEFHSMKFANSAPIGRFAAEP